ncbi:MAG: prefoldin subunit [Nanoarchaeota archaeon]
MKQDKDTEQKINKLQLLEQNMQTFILQRQSLQAQLSEITNASKELRDTKGNVYKIVGNIMVLANKANLEKDLESKRELIELRIKNLEKQENKIREEATELQKDILKRMKNDKEN